MDLLWHISIPWWHLLIRAAVVFLAVIFLLRLSGKRQVGQMGLADFVALLLISNAVQNAMNGGDNSLVGGLILAGALVLLSYGFNYLTYRYKAVENLVQGQPTLLIHRGHLLHQNLEKEWLSVHELRVLLRRQGIHSLDEIEQAVLESDGYISVIHKSDVAPPAPARA